MRSSPQRKGRGFSLVELAVSLALLGLVALGLVAYLRQATQHKVIQQSADIMETAQQALVGFAHANFRLPCPALDGNGIEICGNAQSGLPNQIGQLPWRTLGLANARAGRLRYGVYRAPNANAWLDSDLAVAKDRMVPLNNITANSPGAPSPPIPPVVYDSPADVSNLAHKNPLLGNVNLVDFCYATYRAANAPVSANALATVDANANANANATLRPVAFVLAALGVAGGVGVRRRGTCSMMLSTRSSWRGSLGRPRAKLSWLTQMMKATPTEKPCITHSGTNCAHWSSLSRKTPMQMKPVMMARSGSTSSP